MPPGIAMPVTDGQVLGVAVAALTEGANVLQRGVLHSDMLATHPAGHLPVQLARNRRINFLAGVGKATHAQSVAAGTGAGARVSAAGAYVNPVR